MDEKLQAIGLTNLMERNLGRSDVVVALLDGPVASGQPGLADAHIQSPNGRRAVQCIFSESAACAHGTFMAGMLCARRDAPAPAICPGCTLMIRPVFTEDKMAQGMPFTTPEVLAEAIVECVTAGARILNLSVATSSPSPNNHWRLKEALDYALGRHVIVVAAVGNQGTVGSSTITRHPAVVPIVACDILGRPLGVSNLGAAAGLRGLAAPGEAVTSLTPSGASITLSGTSVAAPFVTGAFALLFSEFPNATTEEVKYALTQSSRRRRSSIVPPLMNAAAAYRLLAGGRASSPLAARS